MNLTGNELEVMTVLWDSEISLTTTEIIERTPNRTWQEGSIFAIMNTLVKKGAVVLETYKPTQGKHARAYKPLVTSEEYAIASIDSMQDKGIKIDIDKLVDGLMKKRK
ncbi:MAG: BlaI/MecI/CopY family transcriptional regulator [Defluviitaleaceae bacterium]|nr:BlaI/MecI/CopY family transcriptional regulator [Defluviitaleaceae bacterium]